MKQTEELFANGKVTSGGGRGKSFAEGTAFSKGSGGFWKVVGAAVDGAKKTEKKTTTKTTTKSSKDKTTVTTTTEVNSGGSSGSGGGIKNDTGSSVGSDTKDKFEETIDWIETLLDRAERVIDKYERQADNVYKTWSNRNRALENEIAAVDDAINSYRQAQREYTSELSEVGLPTKYAAKVRSGSLNIEDFEGEGDEKLVEKIKKYQDLYNKYLECTDKINELKEKEASLYSQRFDNVSKEYDNLLQGFGHTESMLNEYISQAEAQGHVVSKNYYDALINNEEDRIDTLKQEQAALIKARDEAVANQEFSKYSEDWYLIMPTYLAISM